MDLLSACGAGEEHQPDYTDWTLRIHPDLQAELEAGLEAEQANTTLWNSVQARFSAVLKITDVTRAVFSMIIYADSVRYLCAVAVPKS